MVDSNTHLRSFRQALAVLGIPVIHDDVQKPTRPWLVWMLLAVVWLLFILGFGRLEYVATHYGFGALAHVRTDLHRYFTFALLQDNISELLIVTWVFINCAHDMEAFLGKVRLLLATLVWMVFTAVTWGMIYAGEELWLWGMSGLATMVITYFYPSVSNSNREFLFSRTPKAYAISQSIGSKAVCFLADDYTVPNCAICVFRNRFDTYLWQVMYW